MPNPMPTLKVGKFVNVAVWVCTECAHLKEAATRREFICGIDGCGLAAGFPSQTDLSEADLAQHCFRCGEPSTAKIVVKERSFGLCTACDDSFMERCLADVPHHRVQGTAR